MDSLAVCVFQEIDKETVPVRKWVLNRDQACESQKNSCTSKSTQTNSPSGRVVAHCTKQFVNIAKFYTLC